MNKSNINLILSAATFIMSLIFGILTITFYMIQLSK